LIAPPVFYHVYLYTLYSILYQYQIIWWPYWKDTGARTSIHQNQLLWKAHP